VPDSPAGPSALILTRGDVADLLDAEGARAAVEEAFRRHGSGRAAPPRLLGFPVSGGGFHIKVAIYGNDSAEFFVAKTNANLPDNPTVRGLPTVQGVIQVFDAQSGGVLAIMDSIEVTALRTAAATAVAAKYLARDDAAIVTIAGCGTQGRAHACALAAVRTLEHAFLWDPDPRASERLAAELEAEPVVRCTVIGELSDGVRQSDIVVTCTPSTRYLVGPECVAAGTFIAGVGADSEEKRELDPRLLAQSAVVVDIVEQCAAIGDLHHALDAGTMTRQDVYAELGEIVAGRKPGRTARGETFVFDSTGMALQDAAVAVMVLERARTQRRGLRLDLGAGALGQAGGAALPGA